MFLKEFAINRYGPLPGSGRKLLGNFNLFYGPNEEGKTLTIDALIKILFGKAIGRSFDAVKRVEEKPEGYIILETGEKKEEIKLPERGIIPELFGMSASEFGNIFIIRDSDLSIKSESSIYRGVTARLTGMRGDDITKLKMQVQQIGNITAGGELINQAPNKLKDRWKRSQLLVDKIIPLQDKLREGGFNRFEEELVLSKENYQIINKKISRYRSAQARESYEKGLEAIQSLEEAMAALKQLKNYKKDDYDHWQRNHFKLEQLYHEKSSLLKEENEKRAALERAKTLWQSKKIALKEKESLQKRALEKIGLLLAEHEKIEERYLKYKTLTVNPTYNLSFLILVLIMFISLTGLIIRPAWWFFPFSAISVVIVFILGWLRFALLGLKSTLAVSDKTVRTAAEKMNLPASDVLTVRSVLGNLSNEVNLAAEEFNVAENEIEWSKRELETITGRLKQNRSDREDLKDTIDRIRQSLAVDKLEEFAERLSYKEEIKVEIEKQKSLLESHFGILAEISGDYEKIKVWKAKIKDLSIYASAEKDLVYDHLAVNKLNKESVEAEKKIEVLQEKMKGFLDELREIEREANDILQYDEDNYLPCQTVLDLEMILQKLQHWCHQREKNKEAALLSLELFTELEEEEEEKVSALFGEDSAVSAYLSKITAGHYRQVIFAGSEHPLKVVRHDGAELDAEKLSGGAFDQLYFSIRLALGEKYLQGQKGFFILDDPFIKADPVRLTVLLQILFEISAAGWQILYFSAKGEIREALSAKELAGEINHLTIDSVS